MVSTATNAQQCIDNFKNEGGFFRGSTFETHVVVPDADAATVFATIYRNMVAEGWQISESNENIGIISAVQTVTYGQGKVAPLNAIVQPQGDGVAVSFTFSTSGGVSARANAVRDGFCTLLEGVVAED